MGFMVSELCLALREMRQSHLAGSISTPEFAFSSNRRDIPRQATRSQAESCWARYIIDGSSSVPLS